MTSRNTTAQLQGLYLNTPGGFFSNKMTPPECPMVSAKFISINGTINLTSNAATLTFPATQKRFKVMGLRVIAQDATTCAYVLQNSSQSNAIATVTQTTPTAGDVTNATTGLDATSSILNPGDVMSLYISRSGSTAPVSVLITVQPIGNN